MIKGLLTASSIFLLASAHPETQVFLWALTQYKEVLPKSIA